MLISVVLNNDLKTPIAPQPHPTDEVFLCSKKRRTIVLEKQNYTPH